MFFLFTPIAGRFRQKLKPGSQASAGTEDHADARRLVREIELPGVVDQRIGQRQDQKESKRRRNGGNSHAAEGAEPEGPRRATFRLCAWRCSGLHAFLIERITDACTLSRERIHKGVLTLRTEKGGTTVRLPLHPEALDALAKVPAKGAYYFWNGQSKRRTIANYWQQLFLEMFRRADLPGAHSHQFRHTFAVSLLTNGVSMEHVSTLLGHRDLKVTQRTYNAFTPQRRDALEQAVRSAW